MKSTLTLLLGLLLFSALHAQVPSYVPTDGLVGWWPFNGNANDESGNGNDGVVNGATLTEDRFGNAASAYSFDGISNYMQTADSPSLSFIGDFTISAWIKQNSPTTGYNSILSKRLGGNWSYNLTVSNIVGGSGQEMSKLTSGRRNNNGAQTEYRFSNTITSIDVWQHALVVVKNDTLKFYLDGSDAGYINGYNGNGGYVAFGNSFSIPMINQPVGVTIGHCNCGLPEYMNGLIDDIALYNRALTEQEIQNLYTGTTPAACTALPANLQNGLVGYWPFCGNANDESGNGNDGVVNGATLTEDRFGNAASAYSFDGVDDFIEVVHDTSLDLQGPYTISVWCNASALVGSYNDEPSVISKFNGWGDGGYTIYMGESVGALNYCYNTSGNQRMYQVGFSTNMWYHVLVIYDGTKTEILVNNSVLQTINVAGNIQTNSHNLLFGRESVVRSTFSHFNGIIDDIAIYNRALTPAEINQLYTAADEPVATCTPLSPNLQNGLVGYWPFCGNANDESGNGNDGVVNGATLTEDRFGNVYGAYDFNSEGSRIELPITSVINGANELTISHSFYLSELEGGGTFGNWYYYASGGGPIGLILGVSSGYLFAAVNGGQDIVSYQSISLQEWNHYTFVFDGNSSEKIKLYLNGVLQDIETLNTNIPFPEALGSQAVDTYLGGRQCENFQPWCFNGLSPSFKGLLDDIAIWNRALTPEEVQELYTGTTPTPAPCVALPANLQEGIVGYWPFCGNANDESGNGNDGVVNGATLTEDRFGNANAAYGFDGVDDFIEVAHSESLNLLPVTISTWFNVDSTSNGQWLVGKYSCASGNGYSAHLNSGRPSAFYYSGNTETNRIDLDVASSGYSSLSYDAWHQAVLVFDSLGLNYYVDGSLLSSTEFIGEGDSIGEPTSTTAPLMFGRYLEGGCFNLPSEYFFLTGSLDDIAIWNRALTPEEVQELYTLDACTFTVYDTLTVENIINVYDTLTIENIVDIYDTTYINVEVYDTLTVENIINVYDTLTIENIVEVYDTLTVENVIDIFDTTTVVETVVVFDTLTVENVIDVFDTTTVVETVVLFDTLTVENVIDVFDTTTVVETVVVFDTLTVENVIDVYDTTYVTVTDTLIIDIPSGVGGTILNTLLLYPNPTSDQLTISYGNFAAMAGYSLSIFDNGGSTVHQTTITQAQETLDITQWSAGVYQVVVYNAGGVPVETRQIVIQ